MTILEVLLTKRGIAVINLLDEAICSHRITMAGLKRIREYCKALGLNETELLRVCGRCSYDHTTIARLEERERIKSEGK